MELLDPEEKSGAALNAAIREIQEWINAQNKPEAKVPVIDLPPAPVREAHRETGWHYNSNSDKYSFVPGEGQTRFYSESQLPAEGRAFFGLDGTITTNEQILPTSRDGAPDPLSPVPDPQGSDKDGQPS